jgi:hypothetical protein
LMMKFEYLRCKLVDTRSTSVSIIGEEMTDIM